MVEVLTPLGIMQMVSHLGLEKVPGTSVAVVV